ncbi:flagellar hook-basal body complex protein FliE [Neorhizobium galegae]|uniref:flagellar hook-basal body complex protein FliE n=1 Tax=Rhizobium/Agrobacterium group TaxID=227290 RepID=UPI001AE60B07|nr:flagellar hook-basal body complex protein FliE [Neorhizobium galegae]MBP2548072.1 flagellar hook-basal body complex protein FliE [Neorhizobium galegae]
MIDQLQNVSSLSLTRGLGASATETSGSSTSIAGSAAQAENSAMSFANVLGNMASEAAGNLKTAEAMSFEGIKGTANTREVVDAVMQAEQSLQTAIAFRDKIVNAYLEITKMQM